jgi:hypothetical protein
VLVGPKRNIETFHVSDQIERASVQVGAQLDIDDISITESRSEWTDLDLLDDDPAIDDTDDLGETILSPIIASLFSLGDATTAAQQRNSYTITASGTLRGGCYPGVLTPYDVVEVSGVDQKQCTKYVIREVVHSLGRSEYRQDFTLFTNAVATVDRGGNPVPAEVF